MERTLFIIIIIIIIIYYLLLLSFKIYSLKINLDEPPLLPRAASEGIDFSDIIHDTCRRLHDPLNAVVQKRRKS